MRKVILLPALLGGITVSAGAQTKISARRSCEKPNVNETGGEGVQTIMFNKANCYVVGALHSRRQQAQAHRRRGNAVEQIAARIAENRCADQSG